MLDDFCCFLPFPSLVVVAVLNSLLLFFVARLFVKEHALRTFVSIGMTTISKNENNNNNNHKKETV